MPLVLYDADFSPPCQAVRLLAKCLGLNLQIKEMDMLVKRDNKSPEFLKMNPAHTIPLLDDDGLYIWESRAILTYLVLQYGKGSKLYPQEPKKIAIVENMLNFDLGSLYCSFAEYFRPILTKQPVNEEARTKVTEKLSIFEEILNGRSYAAGDHMTIADISILCTLYIPIVLQFDLKPYKAICAWMAKIKKEMAFYDEVTGKGFDHYRAIVKQMIG